MAVRAEQRRPGLAESLQVDLVANAVARPRKNEAVMLGNRLQIAMVVGVLEAHLHRVVVHIRD